LTPGRSDGRGREILPGTSIPSRAGILADERIPEVEASFGIGS
jgi:hypothetical protein